MKLNTDQNDTMDAGVVTDDLDEQIRALIAMAAQAETALRAMHGALTPGKTPRDLTSAAEELQLAAKSRKAD